MGDRRLVGTALLALHIGKIEAEGRDAALGEAHGNSGHRRMPHVGAGAVRQHVAGARVVRLHQDRGDRADSFDLELELRRLGCHDPSPFDLHLAARRPEIVQDVIERRHDLAVSGLVLH